MAGLLADKQLGKDFEGGSMAIFRLAPQVGLVVLMS